MDNTIESNEAYDDGAHHGHMSSLTADVSKIARNVRPIATNGPEFAAWVIREIERLNAIVKRMQSNVPVVNSEDVSPSDRSVPAPIINHSRRDEQLSEKPNSSNFVEAVNYIGARALDGALYATQSDKQTLSINMSTTAPNSNNLSVSTGEEQLATHLGEESNFKLYYLPTQKIDGINILPFVNVILLAIINSPVNKKILSFKCWQTENAKKFAMEFTQLQKNGDGHKNASKLREIVDPTDNARKMGKPENFYEKIVKVLPEPVRKLMQFNYAWIGICKACNKRTIRAVARSILRPRRVGGNSFNSLLHHSTDLFEDLVDKGCNSCGSNLKKQEISIDASKTELLAVLMPFDPSAVLRQFDQNWSLKSAVEITEVDGRDHYRIWIKLSEQCWTHSDDVTQSYTSDGPFKEGCKNIKLMFFVKESRSNEITATLSTSNIQGYDTSEEPNKLDLNDNANRGLKNKPKSYEKSNLQVVPSWNESDKDTEDNEGPPSCPVNTETQSNDEYSKTPSPLSCLGSDIEEDFKAKKRNYKIWRIVQGLNKKNQLFPSTENASSSNQTVPEARPCTKRKAQENTQEAGEPSTKIKSWFQHMHPKVIQSRENSNIELSDIGMPSTSSNIGSSNPSTSHGIAGSSRQNDFLDDHDYCRRNDAEDPVTLNIDNDSTTPESNEIDDSHDQWGIRSFK